MENQENGLDEAAAIIESILHRVAEGWPGGAPTLSLWGDGILRSRHAPTNRRSGPLRLAPDVEPWVWLWHLRIRGLTTRLLMPELTGKTYTRRITTRWLVSPRSPESRRHITRLPCEMLHTLKMARGHEQLRPREAKPPGEGEGAEGIELHGPDSMGCSGRRSTADALRESAGDSPAPSRRRGSPDGA